MEQHVKEMLQKVFAYALDHHPQLTIKVDLKRKLVKVIKPSGTSENIVLMCFYENTEEAKKAQWK